MIWSHTWSFSAFRHPTRLSTDKRNALLKKQQEIFAEDLPSLPLYFRLDLTTYPKALRNVKPVGLGSYYIPWNVWEWKWGDQ